MQRHVLNFIFFAILVQSFASGNKKDLSVLTWNVLSQIYEEVSVSELQDGSIDPALIDADVRTVLQIHNIRKYDPDVMCLQEMDESRYKLYEKEFGREYGSWFAPHGSNHWVEYINHNQTNVPNGNAIFYRKSKLIAKHYESFHLSENENTAPFVVFRRRMSPIMIAMGCVHTESGAKPEHFQARAMQLGLALQKFTELRNKFIVDVEIITGDFNEGHMFPASQSIIAAGFKNVFELIGSTQPMTLFGDKEFFNSTVFPLDYVYVRSYDPSYVTVEQAMVPDLRDEKLDFTSHILTIEMLLKKIMAVKESKIREANPATYSVFMTQIINAFQKVKPKLSPLSHWKEDLRTRSFRLGSDHLFIKSSLKITKKRRNKPTDTKILGNSYIEKVRFS